MRDFRKPVPQGPGWACFHCDEVFLTQGEAEDHFGFSGYEDSDEHNPACVERLTFGEKALRAALMDMFRELEAEQEESHELQDVVESLQGIRPDLERLFDGASTPHQAWLKMDSVEGRALAAEAIIAALEKTEPELVAAAREEVCRPPTKTAA